MMTPSKLRSLTVKELAEMAKKQQIAGCHSMRKDELVRALANAARAEAARKARKKKAAAKNVGAKKSAKKAAAKKSAKTSSVKKKATKKAAKKKAVKKAVKKKPVAKRAPAKKASPKKSASSKATAKKKTTSKKKAAVAQTKPAASIRRTVKAASKPAADRNGKVVADKVAKNASKNGKVVAKPVKKPVVRERTPEVDRHVAQLKERIARMKELDRASASEKNGGAASDRLVLLVRDAYWLHAYWELRRRSIERVRSAMGRMWHTATPVLRLFQLVSDNVSSIERRFVRDIVIHGAVNNWYIDVQDPPACYLVEIGYRSEEGRFYALAKSNSVETPQLNEAVDGLDGNWAEVAEDFERIYALTGGGDGNREREVRDVLEEKLKRPVGREISMRVGPGARVTCRGRREINFAVDAEMIVHGAIDPGYHVAIKNKPVRVHDDGTFSVRFNLPERRLVLPIVASTHDGIEQRTIVLAVERNTKPMEPIICEPGGSTSS